MPPLNTINQTPTANRKRLIIMAAFFLLIVVGFYIYTLSKFHLVSSTPNPTGITPTAINGFSLKFNRPLAEKVDYTKQLSDPGKHVKSISASGNTLLVVTSQPGDGNKYQFKIENIKANDGQVIKQINFNYTARYKSPESFTKAETELLNTLANQYKNDNPILKYLPHSTSNYSLAGEFTPEEGALGKFFLNAKITLAGSDVRTGRDKSIAKYKQQINDYITSVGFKPEQFTIYYQIIEY